MFAVVHECMAVDSPVVDGSICSLRWPMNVPGTEMVAVVHEYMAVDNPVVNGSL